jgi:hypothetical protein
MFLACAQTRFSQLIKIDNITPAAQRHPSADPDIPQIPNSLVWYNSIFTILFGGLYVCEKKFNL